jgi:hypothetical protein
MKKTNLNKERIEEQCENIFKKNPNLSSSQIADQIFSSDPTGYTYSTLKKIIKNKLKGKLIQKNGCIKVGPPVKFQASEQSWDEKGDTAEFSYNGAVKITNLDQALKFCKVDLSVWEVERHIFNKWDTTFKDKNDIERTIPNFQVKIWFKRKKTSGIEVISELLEELKKSKPVVPFRFKKYKEEVAVEIDIFDPHFGKLAWREETGEDYDLKITEKRYDDAIADLLAKCSGFNISRFIYPIGNDYFHYDTLEGKTTGGTPQNIDGRWQKMWKVGREVAIRNIEKLSLIAPVDVVIVPSNHDFETIWKFGDLLECYFHKNKNVTVDNKPTSRKYYRWGKCGIGFTHGNEEKHTDLPLIMMRTMQKQWADVEFMEFHCGHFHKSKKINFVGTDEFNGIIIRFLKSLSGTDAWHAKRGYVKGIKGAEAYVWHKDQGLIGNFITNLL